MIIQTIHAAAEIPTDGSDPIIIMRTLRIKADEAWAALITQKRTQPYKQYKLIKISTADLVIRGNG